MSGEKSDGEDTALLALRALAKEKGQSVEQVLSDLLKAKADEKREPEQRTDGGSALASTGERGVETYKFQRNSMTSPHLSAERIAMYERESAAEARVRWAEEEAELPGGVFSPGGMTGGGIFGGGPVATETYDPESEMRYEQRVTGQVQVKTLQVLERMSKQIDERDREIARLKGAAPQKALPGRRRG